MVHGPANSRRGIDNTLSFNLLGLGDVIASVVMEHDELLDAFVGTMQIHGPLELQRFQREGTASETLTEAKVQQLERSPRMQQPLTTTVRSLRSSRSRSSQVRTLTHRSGLGSPRSPRPIRLWGARQSKDVQRCHQKVLEVAAVESVGCHAKVIDATGTLGYWRSVVLRSPLSSTLHGCNICFYVFICVYMYI